MDFCQKRPYLKIIVKRDHLDWRHPNMWHLPPRPTMAPCHVALAATARVDTPAVDSSGARQVPLLAVAASARGQGAAVGCGGKFHVVGCRCWRWRQVQRGRVPSCAVLALRSIK